MNQSPEPALPFDAPPPRPSARARARQFGARLVYWTPVWVPMIVLAQVALLGLRPALAESRRLAAEEQRMGQRLERERADASVLERTLRAQDDPIYLERERRLLRLPDSPLGQK